MQACAAVGQSRLMSMYDDAFDKLGFASPRCSSPKTIFSIRARHENLRATLTTLLQLGVIPIINENDTVSTAELDRPAGGPAPGPALGQNVSASLATTTSSPPWC